MENWWELHVFEKMVCSAAATLLHTTWTCLRTALFEQAAQVLHRDWADQKGIQMPSSSKVVKESWIGKLSDHVNSYHKLWAPLCHVTTYFGVRRKGRALWSEAWSDRKFGMSGPRQPSRVDFRQSLVARMNNMAISEHQAPLENIEMRIRRLNGLMLKMLKISEFAGSFTRQFDEGFVSNHSEFLCFRRPVLSCCNTVTLGLLWAVGAAMTVFFCGWHPPQRFSGVPWHFPVASFFWGDWKGRRHEHNIC